MLGGSGMLLAAKSGGASLRLEPPLTHTEGVGRGRGRGGGCHKSQL
jgi:hypothetical protein